MTFPFFFYLSCLSCSHPHGTYANRPSEEFALLEVAYTVARMVQAFPNIDVPAGHSQVAPGLETQNLTLVVSSAEGCVVSLKR